MPINRFGKNREYDAVPAASGGFGSGAYSFDDLFQKDFALVASLSGGIANSAIQGRLPLAQRMVIVKIVVNVTAFTAPTGTSATAAFNIVVGTGAEAGTIGSPQAVAAAGQSVFAVDKSFATITPDTPFVYVPDNPEAWYGNEGVGADILSLLTLRVTLSGGSTNGSLSNLQVGLLLATVDTKPEINTANPATDF